MMGAEGGVGDHRVADAQFRQIAQPALEVAAAGGFALAAGPRVGRVELVLGDEGNLRIR